MPKASFDRRGEELRHRMAQEAARILAEEGVRDYLMAKRKASERLGLDRAQQRRIMPTNVEIESALNEHLRLFHGDTQPERLRELRAAAVEAMHLLRDFSPRLVGGVLDGSATLHADVCLHVFAEMPEAVYMHLIDSGIPADIDERRLRQSNGKHDQYPVYRFLAGDISLDITVFAMHEKGHAPRSPIDGRPMKRANLTTVKALLEETEDVI
ncbi:hypothetical protein J2T60_002008 [Natronospira proteinivora]|uniref:Nucleotidyltransferase n=1 Tax=Natronospira proteinivora TaxID=1807133 RepID=A0ABT1G9L6_9GAMM|nr:hypothetical protein [Natronospira proteinivora]MCP1728008.1 hypothetical protein [Natronospira proteinivora]